jgi:hypothetical protein
MYAPLYRLIEAYRRVDRELRRAQMRRSTGSLQLMRSKRMKLRVKDLIRRFTRRALGV